MFFKPFWLLIYMKSKVFSAVALILIIILSGCISEVNSEEKETPKESALESLKNSIPQVTAKIVQVMEYLDSKDKRDESFYEDYKAEFDRAEELLREYKLKIDVAKLEGQDEATLAPYSDLYKIMELTQFVNQFMLEAIEPLKQTGFLDADNALDPCNYVEEMKEAYKIMDNNLEEYEVKYLIATTSAIILQREYPSWIIDVRVDNELVEFIEKLATEGEDQNNLKSFSERFNYEESVEQLESQCSVE